MKNIMRFLCCLISFALWMLVTAPGSYALEPDSESYFSSPEQADAADARAHAFAVSESEKAAGEVAAIVGEVKAAKSALRDAAKKAVAAEKVGRKADIAAATNRLAAARVNLAQAEKKAAKAVAAITAVKSSTISSMRSQQMGWGEITRELGATKNTISPRKSVSRESMKKSGPGSSGRVGKSERVGKDRRSGRSVSRRGKIGTTRDLRSGRSKTPGAIGGKGDKALGLSRISEKARSGSKESRSAKSVAALGGRGNVPNAQEAASMAARISKAKERPGKAQAKVAAMKARARAKGRK